MNIHPRTRIVSQAESELRQFLVELEKKHGLTEIECLTILSQLPPMYLKYMLRTERHPNDPGKPADEV